jgi:hypothetical protein
MKIMEYPIIKAFEALNTQGVEKVIAMMKLALKEMPRLEAAFMDLTQQKNALAEIRMIFKYLGDEMGALVEANPAGQEKLREALYDPKKYTREEWTLLARFNFLLKQFGPMLLKTEPKSKKPKWIYPKA